MGALPDVLSGYQPVSDAAARAQFAAAWGARAAATRPGLTSLAHAARRARRARCAASSSWARIRP